MITLNAHSLGVYDIARVRIYTWTSIVIFAFAENIECEYATDKCMRMLKLEYECILD